jgi:protein-disulfide isomerase
VSDTGTRTATRPDPEPPVERNNVLLIVVGVLTALSVVIAALVIFSEGGGSATKPVARAQVRAVDAALVVGKDDAPTKVVVYEDFASQPSRELDIASRDFLKIEAARGRVRVEYRPFATGTDPYSAQAMAAWTGVLSAGTPNQALTFHNLLFDRQPDPGSNVTPEFTSWAKEKGIDESKVLDAIGSPDQSLIAQGSDAATAAGVSGTPMVIVNGKPFTAATPVALADKLQRLLLGAS